MNDLKDVLIVIDMQNDFIDGALGTKEAKTIVPNVKMKIMRYIAADKHVIFTQDTHFDDYLDTLEGKKLPVPHCIYGTDGHEIYFELDKYDSPNIAKLNKSTFGYTKWDAPELGFNSYELCGVCTDICVISNALILRALKPNAQIVVDSSCCAGVTPELHESALKVMQSCQIEVI